MCSRLPWAPCGCGRGTRAGVPPCLGWAALPVGTTRLGCAGPLESGLCRLPLPLSPEAWALQRGPAVTGWGEWTAGPSPWHGPGSRVALTPPLPLCAQSQASRAGQAKTHLGQAWPSVALVQAPRPRPSGSQASGVPRRCPCGAQHLTTRAAEQRGLRSHTGCLGGAVGPRAQAKALH